MPISSFSRGQTIPRSTNDAANGHQQQELLSNEIHTTLDTSCTLHKAQKRAWYSMCMQDRET